MMCFNENIASSIGFLEAVIVEKIKFLMNHKSNNNVIKGVNWVYNTYDQWLKIFPFVSKRSIRRAFGKLENIGILKSGYFCRNKTNRTKWYTVDHAVLNSFDIGTCVQIGHMDKANGVENDAKLATSMCPNWPHPLTQELSNNNTNNNTKVLGSTKYPELGSTPRGNVVVPVEYNGFDNLPRPVPQKRLQEQPPATQSSKSANNESQVKIIKLPKPIIDALNAGNFWNAFVNFQNDLSKIIQSHGEKYILEKIELMNKSSVEIRNPRKWLERAIEKITSNQLIIQIIVVKKKGVIGKKVLAMRTKDTVTNALNGGMRFPMIMIKTKFFYALKFC